MRRMGRYFGFSIALVLSGASIEAQSLEERFARLDRDGDGRVTAAELNQPEIFERFDRNDDGVIEVGELRDNARPANRRSAGTAGLVMPEEPAHAAFLDLAYDRIEGVDPNLLSLDIYAPEGAVRGEGRRVVIMIHGGGWRGGDKANPAIVGAKMRHFVAAGGVYVSLNYRLSAADPEVNELIHPVHVRDCAKALAWIHDHIADYGGDPDQLHLMGHSAGGHLAGLVATNQRFLKAEGKDLSILKSNVLLDPAAIDVPGYLEAVAGGGMTRLYHLAFGQDPDNHRDASPQDHVSAGKGIPPTLIFYAGDRMALDRFAPAFAASMNAAGVPAQAVDTVTLDHGQINSHIGMIDEPMTVLITRLHAGEDASTFPSTLEPHGVEPEVEARESEQPTSSISIRFEFDYSAGSRDAAGRFMGGTETMRLVAHTGRLFAGLSYWTDEPGDDPRPGAQILVKEGPDDGWKVSQNFPGAVRISAMESFTFVTDAEGKVLDEPVTLLLADAGHARSRVTGPLICYVFDPISASWRDSPIALDAPRAYIRAFGFHRDLVTGIDHVFAGTGAGEIYRGAYDAEADGRIRWDPLPEYANPDFNGSAFQRCQGLTVANGKLYASVSPRLLERVDGSEPTWREVFRWDPQERAGAGLRGITAVHSPDGGHQVIIGSREQEGRILRIDPVNGFAVTDELSSREFLIEELGAFRGGKLVAYNRLVPGTHPNTGEPIHWLTVAGLLPDASNTAWLLVRHADARYETARVVDEKAAHTQALVSTRTLEYSPWEQGVVYVGGYDGAANQRRNHNTAWIYKGRMIGELGK